MRTEMTPSICDDVRFVAIDDPLARIFAPRDLTPDFDGLPDLYHSHILIGAAVLQSVTTTYLRVQEIFKHVYGDLWIWNPQEALKLASAELNIPVGVLTPFFGTDVIHDHKIKLFKATESIQALNNINYVRNWGLRLRALNAYIMDFALANPDSQYHRTLPQSTHVPFHSDSCRASIRLIQPHTMHHCSRTFADCAADRLHLIQLSRRLRGEVDNAEARYRGLQFQFGTALQHIKRLVQRLNAINVPAPTEALQFHQVASAGGHAMTPALLAPPVVIPAETYVEADFEGSDGRTHEEGPKTHTGYFTWEEAPLDSD